VKKIIPAPPMTSLANPLASYGKSKMFVDGHLEQKEATTSNTKTDLPGKIKIFQ
jgi:hypothetical protein